MKFMGLWNKGATRRIEALERQLEDVTYRLGLLLEFSRVVTFSESEQVVDLLLSSAANVSGVKDISVSLIQKGDLRLRAALGTIDESEYAKTYKESPIWECFQSGQGQYNLCDTPMNIGAVFPLVFKDQIYGVLALHSPCLELNERDIDYIQSFADYSTIALKNNWEYRKLAHRVEYFKQKAAQDPLTGLYNRQILGDIFKSGMAQAVRSQSNLSILIYDIDHFKKVNDTFGHPFGDLVIKEVAEITKSILRANDFAFRYGGEEFLLILSGAGAQEAFQVGERIRKAVEKHVFREGKVSHKVTISCGVAQWNKKEEGKQLISRADRALYRAKEEGRNRVKVSK